MHRTIDPKRHGVIDYALVAVFALAPTLFGFAGVASSLSYLLATVLFVVSALTRYPLGLAKVIPFPVHGILEAGAAVFAIISPWLFGFSEVLSARWFFVLVGLGVVVLFALTNYRAVPVDSQPLTQRRRVTL